MDVLASLYAIVAGLGLLYFETRSSYAVANKGLPHHGICKKLCIVYLVVSLPGFLALPTLFGSVHLLFASVAYAISFKRHEMFAAKRKPSHKSDATWLDRAMIVLKGRDTAARVGRMLCIGTFTFGCLYVGIDNAVKSADGIKAKPEELQFTAGRGCAVCVCVSWVRCARRMTPESGALWGLGRCVGCANFLAVLNIYHSYPWYMCYAWETVPPYKPVCAHCPPEYVLLWGDSYC